MIVASQVRNKLNLAFLLFQILSLGSLDLVKARLSQFVLVGLGASLQRPIFCFSILIISMANEWRKLWNGPNYMKAITS